MGRPFRVMVWLTAGVAVGLLCARFTARDYLHASLTLREGGETKPILIAPGPGKRTLALSVRNEQEAPALRITVAGGEIASAQPPPLPLFRAWPSLHGEIFAGLRRGTKIPLSIVLDGRQEEYELRFARLADNSVLQRVPIVRGMSHGGH